MSELELSVGEFVSLINQTLEYAYPNVTIIGELSNFHISKNRWIYFDLKDGEAVVHFFGAVYQLPGPLEDGILLKVWAQPRLHPQYGFNLTVQHIEPSGEGAIRHTAKLLEAKLKAEGLFDASRKRPIPYPPKHIGLITSIESAAYSDFIKILSERWSGIDISLIDVQVQGKLASEQIIQAVEQFNQQAQQPDVLVITRGGGSIEDLQVFNNEQVTRAIAISRIPTLIAVGHERDISLAELAADLRASTPSNAAELLVPERERVLEQLRSISQQLHQIIIKRLKSNHDLILDKQKELLNLMSNNLNNANNNLLYQVRLLAILNPHLALQKGYVILRKEKIIVRSVHELAKNDIVSISLKDGQASAAVSKIL